MSVLPGSDVGVIGLGVMGQNLALNIKSRGYTVTAYNRTPEKTKRFVGGHPEISGAFSLQEFVDSLSSPRKVLMMVTAGQAVDETISGLEKLLGPGDLLIDGGNSFFKDTERRYSRLAANRIHFLGLGVSGGEEGALKGPCLMAGGDPEGYGKVSEILTRIAAQADGPCCQLLGPAGAGHYVKMIHNGIEYAIIQIIAEAYDTMNRGAKLKQKQIREIFIQWNKGELGSFLMEVTTEVLGKIDPETGQPLVAMILDRAQQKGTGKWTSQNALDLGVPIPTVDAAVAARNLSALKDERVQAASALPKPKPRKAFGSRIVAALQRAVLASVIVSYAQGFHLMRAASKEYSYRIPFSEVARIWKGGCIIRAKLLDHITRAFRQNPDITNLMLYPEFAKKFGKLEKNWRDTLNAGKASGIPMPAMDASLDYYDAYRSERLPANLIQALRDRFGAHHYERTDKPGSFHTDWI